MGAVHLPGTTGRALADNGRSQLFLNSTAQSSGAQQHSSLPKANARSALNRLALQKPRVKHASALYVRISAGANPHGQAWRRARSAAQLRAEQRLRLRVRGGLERRAQLAAERLGQRDGHRVADLAVLVVHVAVEAERVREALHAGEGHVTTHRGYQDQHANRAGADPEEQRPVTLRVS